MTLPHPLEIANATRTVTTMLVLVAGASSLSRAQSASSSEQLALKSQLARTVPTALHSAALARSVGADIATITAEDIAASGAASLSELLRARVPGLSVLRPGGTTVEGSTVRVRGPVSRLFTNEPLIIIDGVPTQPPQQGLRLQRAVATSRLDDIPIEPIERIDVLRGPAAAALFGPGAAAGVLVITTRRAQRGAMRISGRVDGGIVSDRTHYPANYTTIGVNPATGAPATSCVIVDRLAGRCTSQQMLQWNPLEQASPFRTGRELAATAWADGSDASTGVEMAFGGHMRRIGGVTPDDEITRSGAHLNIARSIGRSVSIDGTVRYGRVWASLPTRAGSTLPNDVLSSGLFGTAVDDSSHGYRNGKPIFGGAPERVENVGLSVRTTWTPLRWLTIAANAGRERATEGETNTLSLSNFGTLEEIASSRMNFGNVGGSAEARARGENAELTSVLGYDDRRVRAVELDSVARGQLFASRGFFGRDHHTALTWQERLAWRNALFINAGVTWDPTGLVKELPRASFNEVDASWLPPVLAGIKGLRLRAARGVSGANVNFGPLGFSGSQFPFPVIAPRSTLDGERTQQTEVGADAPAGRGRVALTFHHTLTRHLVIPFSVGPNASGFVHDASMKSAGFEAMLVERLLSTSSFRWDLAAGVESMRSKVLSLGLLAPIIRLYTETLPGYTPDGFWQRPWSFSDANGDGLIDSSEVHVSPERRFLGASAPTLEAFVRSKLQYRQWSLGVVLDHRGGFRHLNNTETLRCAILICRGLQDPSASLEEQARAVAGRFKVGDEAFIENASFVRLQELSVRWGGDRPRTAGASRLLDRLAVSMIAQNVALWTRYKGLDPELDYPEDNTPSNEFAQSPAPLRVLLRVELLPPLP